MILYPHAIFAAAFILLQILDIHSTNAALRQPDVVEVGDTALGLGNIVGWAQRGLGPRWWLVKVPLIAVFAPLLWTPVPLLAELPLCFLLGAADGYFAAIIKINYANAQPREKETPTCRPMP